MNKILQLLEQATDADLILSRFDCHVKGLHSIVLKNDNGRLTRCFLADFNHQMYHTDDRMALGVHNHLYALTLEGVSGKAINHNYMVEKVRGSVFYDAYGFQYGKLIPEKLCALKYQTYDILVKDTVIQLASDDLHTVTVEKGQRASWLVFEGVEENYFTYMFTLNPNPVCKFTPATSADQVRAFVKNFYA